METAAPEVRFRPLTRDDLPTLARWLAEPLVARWWSENSPDRVEQDFGPYLDDAQTECIAEPAARGRGAGAAMAARSVSEIWARHPDASCVIVPVNIENPRSWAALLRAGFRRLPDAELTPDNPGDTPLHAICRIDRPARGDAGTP